MKQLVLKKNGLLVKYIKFIFASKEDIKINNFCILFWALIFSPILIVSNWTVYYIDNFINYVYTLKVQAYEKRINKGIEEYTKDDKKLIAAYWMYINSNFEKEVSAYVKYNRDDNRAILKRIENNLNVSLFEYILNIIGNKERNNINEKIYKYLQENKIITEKEEIKSSNEKVKNTLNKKIKSITKFLNEFLNNYLIGLTSFVVFFVFAIFNTAIDINFLVMSLSLMTLIFLLNTLAKRTSFYIFLENLYFSIKEKTCPIIIYED